MFEQSELDLHVTPEIVERIWDASDRHYASTSKRLTMDRLEDLLFDANPDLPWSKPSILRARKKYPSLLPWPMLKHYIRPWLVTRDHVPVALKADDLPSGGPSLELPGFERIQVEVTIASTGEKGLLELSADRNGVLHVLGQLRQAPSVLAAGVAAMVMLDAMDGKTDAVVHWCQILHNVLKLTQF